MMTKPLLARLILSLLLGAIAVFSYSPFDIWPLAYVSFTGLLLLTKQKSAKQTALIAFIWGFGYFLAGIHWVYVSINQYGDLSIPVAIIILSLLVAYLALYPMLFAVLLRLFNKVCPAYSLKQFIILAPLIWQITEYIRSTLLNGFAWLQFGYSQLESPLAGLFPILGINGVNLLFTICCGLLAYLVQQFIQRRLHLSKYKLHIYGASCTILVIFAASFWFKHINWTQLDYTRQTNITLIQGNIPQSLRWSSKQLNKTLQTYAELTQEHIKDSDIIIWPEAAITDFEYNQQPYLKALDLYARQHDTAIALGIVDLVKNEYDYQIYNALIVLGGLTPYQYPTKNRYIKHHLVPFGEYIPLQQLLSPIAKALNIPMSSMSAGPAIQEPLTMKGFKFVTVICYEVILSNLLWQNFTSDTDFLLTVSNDAWFGNSIGPWQHLQMARTRALEFGRTLLRSTNNGITTVISPKGSITKQLPQFQTAALSVTLNPNTGLTPYARWGNYPYYLILTIFIIIIFLRQKHLK
ncbi:apolipoprotein N-acyltransferase [Orbus sturtevantii]|uniref:apolipoprotein N-acyltransferase n=1 Tax=Orbus sturtevantii TaxID=3074109 RepID=UPI00370D5AE7